MARIGLCIIVKNEVHIIRRCLESTLPLIDFALVVDTGSTDGTQTIIREFLLEKHIPGQVIDEPWRDFAYNRSFAMRKLREHKDIDYGLMIDADEVLVYESGFNSERFKRSLVHNIYDVQTRYNSIVYWRPQLFSNRLEFVYRGVIHEFLEGGQKLSRDFVRGFFNRPHQDSARSQNSQKFRDDADVLEKALREETDPFMVARYTFYLAQSYRDCGEKKLALEAYLRRAQLGYWAQEVYISLLFAARLKEDLGYDEGEVIQSFLAAYEVVPERVEALHGAVRVCRLRGKHWQGYILGKYALGLQYPKDGLFVEAWVYDYGLLDEFSILAYWSGHYRECFEACLKLLRIGKIPPDYRERVRKNAEYSIEKLNNPNLRKLLLTL